MYPTQPNNHNVGYGEHTTSASSAFHSSTASGGDQSPNTTRSRPLKPVDSVRASQEASTPDQASPTISDPPTCTSSPFPQQPQLDLDTTQKPTYQDSMHDPCLLILEYMGEGAVEVAECFRSAAEQPPITKESLEELDMNRIVNNPKLRHDCNFDRDLHFRPNLDGPKGKQKIKSAEDFWKALEGELFVYGVVHQQMRDPQQAGNVEFWRQVLVAGQKRLPEIFRTIRDILKSLVPDADQPPILERLDVDLIMQEIMNGVCDLIDLGNWLAKVLKHHCAPMRDRLVDAMQEQIRCGASEDKPGKLVNGIRQLLSILEAMRLDVANHQIRNMRPLLIEDTVNFQRKYNSMRISLGKLNAEKARAWLEEERAVPLADGRTPTHLEALTAGVLKSLLFYDPGTGYPQTFYIDSDRLRGIRLDLHTCAYHVVCRDVLLAFAPNGVSEHDLAAAVQALYVTVSAIVGIHGRFQDRLKNIAAEIMRIVLILEDRSPPFDSTLLDFIEQQLENDLLPGSSAFEKQAQDLYDRLLPTLKLNVEHYAKMGALQLHDIFVPMTNAAANAQGLGFGASMAPASTGTSTDPDAEIIKRFTHMLVLHWQVFRDLVYLTSSADVEMSGADSTTHSPQLAAVIPVAAEPVAQPADAMNVSGALPPPSTPADFEDPAAQKSSTASSTRSQQPPPPNGAERSAI